MLSGSQVGSMQLSTWVVTYLPARCNKVGSYATVQHRHGHALHEFIHKMLATHLHVTWSHCPFSMSPPIVHHKLAVQINTRLQSFEPPQLVTSARSKSRFKACLSIAFRHDSVPVRAQLLRYCCSFCDNQYFTVPSSMPRMETLLSHRCNCPSWH
jgi:hypothetical protein